MPKVVLDTQNCPCRSLNDVCCIALKNCYEDDIATSCPLIINGTEITVHRDGGTHHIR